MLNYVSHALQPERKPTQYKQPRPDRLADQAKPVGEAKWGLPRLAPRQGRYPQRDYPSLAKASPFSRV
jgi:hypothetical protein